MIDFPKKEFRSKKLKPVAGSKITMLGVVKPLPWKMESQELEVDTTKITAPPCQFAWCLKVQIA